MRRVISLISIGVALVGLALVLYNATLVDRRAPGVVAVTLSAPAGDDRLAQTLTAIDIEFTEPVRTSTVEARFRIAPFVAGAFAWDGSTAIFTPSAKLPADTQFSIWIEAGYEDLVGNVADVPLEPWLFRTVGPPVVVSASPADATTGVPVDGVVDLEFDRLMDTASVESAISLEPPVALHASWSGETVRLSFDSQLRFGTAYTMTVGTAAADTGGNRLREPFVLHFSTVAAGLAAVDIVPAAGASGIGIASQVAIRYDGPIDPETARAAFRITPSVDGDVRIVRLADDRVPTGGSASPAGDPDTILFVPDNPLAPHTTYAVTLAPTVARLDDPEVVAAGQSWTFTTGSPTVSGQNQVAFLSDRSGVRNVWLMNPDGTNPHQLTTELVPVSGFDATGDGSLVAYSAGGIVSVIGIDGEDLVRVTTDGRFEYGAVFTPDDRRLILGRRAAADGADLGWWLVPIPGTDGEERLLLPDGAPPIGSAELGGEGIVEGDGLPAWMPRAAIDPTGAWAVVVTAAGQPVVVDLAPPPLASPPKPVALLTAAAAAWSPRHGTFLVTATGPGSGGTDFGNMQLWMIRTDGSIDQVSGLLGLVGTPGVGIDGTIAVSLREELSHEVRIGVLPAGASTMSRFTPAVGFDDRWPAFSPDGGTLLIGRTYTVRPLDGDGIWSLDLATGVARQLSTDGAYARWLP